MITPPIDATVPTSKRPRTQPGGPVATSDAPRLTARALARLHERYLSAIWRGDDVGEVADWLAAHWDEQAPPMPRSVPDAVSYGGGAGIRWYSQDGVVAGYPPRSTAGCYRIPVGDIPPAVPAPVT